MNASTIFQYLINKNKIRISGYQILKVSNEISSDVIFGMNIKNSILQGNGRLIRFNKKIKFYTLVIKPNFGCSTGAIYRGIKSFSKPSLSQKNINIFNINTLLNLKNDLEIVAFKKYPLLLSIKQKMLNLPKVILVRMTGSGV